MSSKDSKSVPAHSVPAEISPPHPILKMFKKYNGFEQSTENRHVAGVWIRGLFLYGNNLQGTEIEMFAM